MRTLIIHSSLLFICFVHRYRTWLVHTNHIMEDSDNIQREYGEGRVVVSSKINSPGQRAAGGWGKRMTFPRGNKAPEKNVLTQPPITLPPQNMSQKLWLWYFDLINPWEIFVVFCIVIAHITSMAMVFWSYKPMGISVGAMVVGGGGYGGVGGGTPPHPPPFVDLRTWTFGANAATHIPNKNCWGVVATQVCTGVWVQYIYIWNITIMASAIYCICQCFEISVQGCSGKTNLWSTKSWADGSRF